MHLIVGTSQAGSASLYPTQGSPTLAIVPLTGCNRAVRYAALPWKDPECDKWRIRGRVLTFMRQLWRITKHVRTMHCIRPIVSHPLN